MTWSAQQYTKFEAERTRPVRDLLAALPSMAVRTAVDLGCGPGNSTESLAARFPDADITGIDGSADMVNSARARLPKLTFRVDVVERWVYAAATTDTAPSAQGFDVILANAVLHWVPQHAKLFPALVARLSAHGALAVQMPDTLGEAAFKLMCETAADGPWSARLARAADARTSLETVDRYYELLQSTGCTVDIWRTTYYHRLTGGAAAIVEWFKGSGLRPFIDPLDADARAQFLERYQAAVAKAYPALTDDSVLLPFPRLFIVAAR
jgi:trans-aconitate 2-methyltransferase